MMTPTEKLKALRSIISEWSNSELLDVIKESLWTKESKIDLIMENDFLMDDMDEILTEAGYYNSETGQFEINRLCGNAINAEEEYKIYKAAMNDG
jgi:hypothetical protein